MSREGIQIRLEEDLIARLDKEANDHHRPRSTYLRDVLLELLGQPLPILEYAQRLRPRKGQR